MNILLKIIAVFAVGIGVLYWTIANPNTARGLKQGLDSAMDTCAESVDKIYDSLTD